MQTTWAERGTVSGRVALLPRSAEIQPPFERFGKREGSSRCSPLLHPPQPILCPVPAAGRLCVDPWHPGVDPRHSSGWAARLGSRAEGGAVFWLQVNAWTTGAAAAGWAATRACWAADQTDCWLPCRCTSFRSVPSMRPAHMRVPSIGRRWKIRCCALLASLCPSEQPPGRPPGRAWAVAEAVHRSPVSRPFQYTIGVR